MTTPFVAPKALIWAAAWFLGASTGSSRAQESARADTAIVELRGIEVTAVPFNIAVEAQSFAFSYRKRNDADLNSEPGIDLEALAYTVPGLWVNSRTHRATGERITVRGLGWRSPFGVRGIQVIMDGIPLTMADGQAVLNIVDPSFVRELEVIRGPASGFWGNASGGVLYLSTRPPDNPSHRIRARQIFGSYGLVKTDLQVTPALGRHSLSVYGSYLTQDGFRDHSGRRLGRTGLTGLYSLSDDSGLRVFGAYSTMPEAKNPSSLDDSTAAADPTSVRPFIIRQNVAKTSQQGQLGITYFHLIRPGLLRATAYGVFRGLDNTIPSDHIDLGRRAFGTRLTLENNNRIITWGLGLEGRLQRDDRREFTNESGSPGRLVVDQLETVVNGAAFGRASLVITGQLRFNMGLRYDWLRFEADVREDRSSPGRRTFHSLSPSVGLVYNLRGTHLFANVTTALEAPTTTELGNNPDGEGGFNTNVDPERTVAVEIGVQGIVQGSGLGFDVAIFAMQVRNLLEPFYLSDDGPTFFRNAGRTHHLGAEAALHWDLPSRISASATYTLVHATFLGGGADGNSFDGNRVPGVPEQVLGGRVQWKPDAIWLSVDFRTVSSFYVNSENTAENRGYALMGARLSHPGLRLAPYFVLQPFVAVENALNERYNDVVVNAFGGRYYEPAAGRHWQAGLTLQLE